MDPHASDTLYIQNLAAPLTVNTMPEATLKDFADHGQIGRNIDVHGGHDHALLLRFAKMGVSVDALANQLQDEGAGSFVKSWNELLGVISSKTAALKQAA
jgi:transaldolase